MEPWKQAHDFLSSRRKPCCQLLWMAGSNTILAPTVTDGHAIQDQQIFFSFVTCCLDNITHFETWVTLRECTFLRIISMMEDAQ
jgi:hypothetical protein